jgi:hypothetical protein
MSSTHPVFYGGRNYDVGGRDSSVGKATRYGLYGPGIESRWGRDFPHPFGPALGPTQPPIQWVSRPGRDDDYPLHLVLWLKKD